MPSLLEIFGEQESYRLPDAIMAALLAGDREKLVAVAELFAENSLRDYFQSDAGDRSKLKQDFTPDCICDLVAKLMKPGTVLDMCAGTGSLTEAAVKHEKRDFFMQEFSTRTIPFALLNAAIQNQGGVVQEADCLRGTVAKQWEVTPGERFSSVVETDISEAGKFDNVIMNPPYSMAFPDTKEYSFSGICCPASKADFGFVMQGLAHLKEGGRLIAILPHGVLFRGNSEKDFRKYLIERGLISGVIGLPDKLFLNTGIPVFIFILEKGSNDTLFIDASKAFKKGTKQNDMLPEHIERVIAAFRARKSWERYAELVTPDKMAENDYNLNIPRYVNTHVPEPLPDMETLLKELQDIEAEEAGVRRELAGMMRDLCGGDKDMAVVKKHIEILEADGQLRLAL